LSGRAGHRLGVLERLDALPIMRWPGAAEGLVGEAERARRTIPAVAGFAPLGFEEAKHLPLADVGAVWGGMVPGLGERLVGDRQFAVILAAVALKLDLDAGEHAMGGERQDTVGRAFKHSDHATGERLVELVAAKVALAAGSQCSLPASRTRGQSICAVAPVG